MAFVDENQSRWACFFSSSVTVITSRFEIVMVFLCYWMHFAVHAGFSWYFASVSWPNDEIFFRKLNRCNENSCNALVSINSTPEETSNKVVYLLVFRLNKTHFFNHYFSFIFYNFQFFYFFTFHFKKYIKFKINKNYYHY